MLKIKNPINTIRDFLPNRYKNDKYLQFLVIQCIQEFVSLINENRYIDIILAQKRIMITDEEV